MTDKIRWQYMAITQSMDSKVEVHGFDTMKELTEFILLEYKDYRYIRAIRFEELVVQHKVTVSLDEGATP